MEKSAITLLCSTGTMVGRSNGYDYERAVLEIRRMANDGTVCGGELMMLPFYYDKEKKITDLITSSNVPFPITHCEKEVGTDLSRAAFLFADGRRDEAEALTEQNMTVFDANCRFAEKIGSRGLVLHLWGGRESDGHIEYNCSMLQRLHAAAKDHGLELLCENVPSSRYDPLSNWHRVIDALPEVSLIFDTRFGTLHDQVRETLTDSDIIPRICHVHVSDFVGGYRNFANLRPIPHPGEGVVDFHQIKRCLEAIDYRGTVTLESPVMEDDRLNIPKLESSLRFIRDLLG